jgi:glycosyltransferase involved in cell wall biosynthesis
VHALFLEKRPKPLESRPMPRGVHLLNWPDGKGENPHGNFYALAGELRRILQQVKPDLLHAGPLQGPAYLAALAGLHPLVSMSWGSDLLIEARKSAEMEQVTRYTLEHSDALVGDCEPVVSAAVSFGFPRNKITAFPWGVNLDEYSPAGSSELRGELEWNRRFVVISTRNWEPLLGVDVLARGFALSACQNDDLRLLLLGGGSQESLIRGILAEAEVLDKVYFAGRAAEPEMPMLFHSADLYISATHSDGSSVSLMQALACGLPVLVSDIPGNREWVDPGKNGWMFADGSPDELARGILNAARQRDTLSQMGESARLTAEARADWDVNFPRLYEAYDTALGRQP